MRGVSGIEPDRVGVGDEVDLVPAVGQLQSQFGGDDAAAAIGGIARDADVHLPSVASAGLRSRSARAGSRPGDATSPPPNQTRTSSPSTMHRRIADHFGVPGLRARRRLRASCVQWTPSVERARPRWRVLVSIAAGVEHPVEAVATARPRARRARPHRTRPARRVRGSGWRAAFSQWTAVPRARDAEALPPGAVLRPGSTCRRGADADHVRVGDGALVPAPDGPASSTGCGSICARRGHPLTRASDMRRWSLFPVSYQYQNWPLMERAAAIGRDVGCLPVPGSGDNAGLFQPVDRRLAVVAGAVCQTAAVVHRVEIDASRTTDGFERIPKLIAR